MKKVSKIDNINQIRSFLLANIENILEQISKYRKHGEIESDDLFGSGDQVQPSISWITDYSNQDKLITLMKEKESLGIYVSGNPLDEYKRIESYLKTLLHIDTIHIVLVEKIKKVFTKSGGMMLAMELTTTKGGVEGIIFSKKAMQFSSILEEKAIFWCSGKYSVRQNKDEEDNEYDTLPKLLIDNVIPLLSGPMEIINQIGIDISFSTEQRLGEIDWPKVLQKPSLFDKNNPTDQDITLHSSQHQKSSVEIRVSKLAGKDTLLNIKNLLHISNTNSNIQAHLFIQHLGEWKKTKHIYQLNQDTLDQIKEMNGVEVFFN
jgi:DNA polymerase III alpha subunit